MQFTTIEFLIFLAIAAVGGYIIPLKWKYLWLLVMNFIFYMIWNPLYVLFLIYSILVTWAGALSLQRAERRKLVLWICGLLNLSILFWFKYSGFAFHNLERCMTYLGITFKAPTVDLLLPLGISFYTFQSLGYMMDVYKGKISAQKNLAQYALFVSFFPQICAGPIERAGNMLPQISQPCRPDWDRIRSGLTHMIWGYFMKMVLADRIAMGVSQVYGNYMNYGSVPLAAATFLFGIQIYCDFAGYSEIAIGAAKILGFRLMENFRQPYFAENIVDFWRRWHISLSTWFRDYLYIPLGGSRCRTWKRYRNILIVFLASGIWHGAGWNFILWGAIHGFYQIAGIGTREIRDKWKRKLEINTDCFSYHLFQKIVTFCLVDFAWIFFQAPGAKAALGIIMRIISPRYWFRGPLSVGINLKNLAVVALGAMVMLAIDWLRSQGGLMERFQSQNVLFRYAVYYIGIVTVLIFGIYGPGYDPSQFIYSRF